MAAIIPQNGGDKIVIKIKVADAEYQLSVRRDEEALYREASQLIETRINRYAQKVTGRDITEYMRMTLLDVTLAFCRNKDRNDTKGYEQSIEMLTKEINEKLKEK